MRRVGLLLFIIAASGCAGTPEKQTVAVAPATQPYYQPRAAAALAFDPPIAVGQPLASFSRVGRSPAAFAGYEQQQVEYHHLYQQDRQDNFLGDRIDRRAYTVRSTTTVR